MRVSTGRLVLAAAFLGVFVAGWMLGRQQTATAVSDSAELFVHYGTLTEFDYRVPGTPNTLSARIPADLYRQMIHWLPILCVDTVVLWNERILLLERLSEPAKGVLWFPGGRMFKGETFFEAAERLLRHETGVVARAERLMGVTSSAFATSAHSNESTHTVNVNVLAQLSQREQPVVRLNEHHGRHGWYHVCDADLHAYVRMVVHPLCAHLQQQQQQQQDRVSQ